MNPISASDRLVALLRQRISERDRTKVRKSGERAHSVAAAPAGIGAIGALGTATDRQRRRACIQALLAHELGAALINDARFQQIVNRVADSIADDEAATLLLDRVIADLGAP